MRCVLSSHCKPFSDSQSTSCAGSAGRFCVRPCMRVSRKVRLLCRSGVKRKIATAQIASAHSAGCTSKTYNI